VYLCFIKEHSFIGCINELTDDLLLFQDIQLMQSVKISCYSFCIIKNRYKNKIYVL